MFACWSHLSHINVAACPSYNGRSVPLTAMAKRSFVNAAIFFARRFLVRRLLAPQRFVGQRRIVVVVVVVEATAAGAGAVLACADPELDTTRWPFAPPPSAAANFPGHELPGVHVAVGAPQDSLAVRVAFFELALVRLLLAVPPPPRPPPHGPSTRVVRTPRPWRAPRRKLPE